MLFLFTLLQDVLIDILTIGFGEIFVYILFSGDSSNIVRLGLSVTWLYLILEKPVTGLVFISLIFLL
jgi:hypothetical protein